jgi:hypothetical protein
VSYRYRVYEPETPRDLALELVQVWTSEVAFSVGASLDLDSGQQWRIVTIEEDPDPSIDGRVFFEFDPSPN